jgi:hypothetical protein
VVSPSATAKINANRQIRRLVLGIGLVGFRRICPAQLGASSVTSDQKERVGSSG